MWFVVGVVTIAALVFLRRTLRTSRRYTDVTSRWNYDKLRELIRRENIALPAAFVDLDAFDANARTLVAMAADGGKTLRLATKSVRCPFLIKRVLELGRDTTEGLMLYSVDEAAFLASQGLDNFYVAYPTVQPRDVDLALELLGAGRDITLTVDSVDHVTILDEMCRKRGVRKTRLRVAIDLDLSCKLFGGRVVLGAHRSAVDSLVRFKDVVRSIQRSRHVDLVGVMGYEAHVAGLPDDNPTAPIPNPITRLFKKYFYARTLRFRREIAEYCKDNNIHLEFFNGGGTGNLHDAARDPAVTEVTAGSGFLQAQLFDYFADNACSPAICFALQATRVNEQYIVCQSGGFVASGSCNVDKFPKPFANPVRLRHFTDEGFGEVQTPLHILDGDPDRAAFGPGDPVLFRPAKSGEIGEHFNKYILLRDCNVVGRVETYRGLGKVFY